ncbi:lipopolysaccharide biosynthesis protein [Enterococcus dongliensis]|uniref:lipopolysaccharide biosynthesis protein n=1 Tax=Enterococcus dongliensis TaxID=2559925 RepID=UPI00288ED590|nr:hypothetical protein [Enterococcus dongliensis]MDT2670802.1 hypothetical protein [Enterococcus dongliensis]
MNSKAKSIVKNLYYTVAANFVTLFISVLLNLFVPKLLGVKEYSYWQLYVFYSSYVGFLHLGWIDGIYLKIGGEEYDNLDKSQLGSQYWYLALFEFILAIAVGSYAFFFLPSSNKSLILILTATVAVITIAKQFIQYILQSTNRIKEYAHLSRSDRYLYIFFLAVYFILGGRDFFWLISLDILAKLLVTIWGMYQIRDMLFNKLVPLRNIWTEILDNINIGSKLMLSNIASMLIMGTIRFFVQNRWSIEAFGKLSFTLSISNMFLTFINAIGVVMFPLLRRTDSNKLAGLFATLRGLFVPITYSFLLFYVPVKMILVAWLPQYSVSLMYMGILFPMVVYEGRMSLLINTYLKALRREKTILFVNVVTLMISITVGVIIVYVFENLLLSVGLIILCLAFRCNLAEYLLSKSLNIKLTAKIIQETLLSFLFILSNLIVLNDWISFFIYASSFSLFILINIKTIKESAETFYHLMKS